MADFSSKFQPYHHTCVKVVDSQASAGFCSVAWLFSATAYPKANSSVFSSAGITYAMYDYDDLAGQEIPPTDRQVSSIVHHYK